MTSRMQVYRGKAEEYARGPFLQNRTGTVVDIANWRRCIGRSRWVKNRRAFNRRKRS